MTQISVSIQNQTQSNYNVHVYDLFGSGHREVDFSPYALAVGGTSNPFLINEGANGRGTVAYACDGGPSLSNIDCGDGDVIPIE